MRALLLGLAAPLAAMAVPAAPAAAQISSGPALTPHAGAPQRQFVAPPRFHRDFRRDHRRFRNTVVVGDFGFNEAWALYNNRTFEPDSFNGWWHDRPDRSFPRWVRTNQNCTPDRMWWSGSGWRC